MYLCSSSSACGIVNYCTDSKTSELNILGAFFSQYHYACTGDFLHFFSSSIITGCALCGEHELGGGAGRVLLESC